MKKPFLLYLYLLLTLCYSGHGLASELLNRDDLLPESDLRCGVYCLYIISAYHSVDANINHIAQTMGACPTFVEN